ncbi:MAG: PadR family transcriptional regulator [Chloroflexi bacterium]|nr:PadR family transcriptional regulator [Chloroflexota bacterium]
MLQASFTMEYALLGFFRQQPRHGYELYQQFSDPAGVWQVWRLKQSHFYALLAKLETAGYLSATLHPQDARPPRKMFHLTPAGQAVFFAWVRSPVAHARQIRMEFLTKLYFAQQESNEVVQQLLAEQRAVCHTWLAQQQAQAQTHEQPQGFSGFVTQFRLSQLESILAWLETCEQLAFRGHPLHET